MYAIRSYYVKKLENNGYEFEGADASFEILVKKSIGKYNKHFELIGARTITEKRKENEESIAEATVIVKVDGITEHTAAVITSYSIHYTKLYEKYSQKTRFRWS